MTNYVGDDGDNIFTVGLGKNNIDGKGGNDLLILNLAEMVGSLDTFNSGGVMTNNLASDDPNLLAIGIGNIERVNITTGGGNDQFYLFGGDDTVSSGGGDDDINTRAGKAVVDGGAGRDNWTAELSALTYDGVLDLSLPGKQAFYGGSVKAIESLSLTLGAGDDTILTLTGKDGRGTNDTITAGAGDDIVRVGGGQDFINGGDGDDLAIVDFSGIAGDIDTFNSGGVITNNQTGDKLATVGLGGIERVDITGGNGDDQFYLFGGDDTVHGGAGDDDINTRAGKAVVDGGLGIDLWTADLALATANSHLDLSDSGTQAFLGGSVTAIEHLTLTLGSGNDTVLTLTGKAGRGLGDTLNGGAGDDTFLVGGGRDLATGGEGEDTLIIDFSKAKGDFETFNSGGSVTNNLTGADEAAVSIGGFEHIQITGGRGDDQFYTFSGSDTIDGGTGADDMSGNGGNDTYYVDNKGDVIHENVGGGVDLVYSSVGFSLVGADIDNAVLTGLGDNRLTGNALANQLTGNGGANTLIGAGGADTLTGGKGDDTFDFDATTESTLAASDHITDLSNKDVIDLSTIDADTGKAGNQSFTLVGAFSGKAGELVVTYDAGADATYVDADVNGDGAADMRIVLDHDHRSFDNFVL